MMAILPHGMAWSQNGNSTASIHIEAIYCTPVLMSGLPSLTLSKSEILSLDTHHKTFKEALLRLYPKTPTPVIYFLSGTLPTTGILHIRQLTILSIVSHLKDKTSHRSYRTISCCPLISKALDTYISLLYAQDWASIHANAQFQGEGRSHDLASLLLSESINHCLYTASTHHLHYIPRCKIMLW